MMSIYVISNGDLFREAFNSIVLLVGSTTFASALRIALTFGVVASLIGYVKQKDPVVFFKWFVMYVGIMSILFIPKASVEIIDQTNPLGVYAVDNVPMGLALPASIITSVGNALMQSFDESFHTSESESYSKTGFLFGSKIVQSTLQAEISSAKTKLNFNSYVKNCVYPDILISKKYSFDDLKNTTDTWGLMTSNPSPARGLFYKYSDKQTEFLTCAESTSVLETDLKKDADQVLELYSLNTMGGASSASEAQSIYANNLMSSYQFYNNMSQGASDILFGNIVRNSARDGVLQYAGEQGNLAAIEEYTNAMNMYKTRMGWYGARKIAEYQLPLMQTIILLIMFCCFPLMLLLSLTENLTISIWKNYIYSIVWTQSWPLLYAILNFATTYEIEQRTSLILNDGLALSNADPITLMHSDLANLSGYLALAIPFISIGLVKGMAQAFNVAANYLGGMAHGIASSTAGEIASGNISVGNTSVGNHNFDNTSAHKHDTNLTNMHGLNTNQLDNGATITTTPSGDTVVNTSGAISNLPTTISLSQATIAHASTAHDHALSQATSDSTSLSNTITSAANKITHHTANASHSHNDSHGFSKGQSTSVDDAVSNLTDIAKSVGDKNDANITNNLQSLLSGSLHASLSGRLGADAKIPIGNSRLPLPASASAGADVRIGGGFQGQYQHSSTSSNTSTNSVYDSLTDTQKQSVQDSIRAITSYNENHGSDTIDGTSSSFSKTLSDDFRTAQNLSHQISHDYSEAQRYSKIVSYAQNNSANINSNASQEWVSYVHEQIGPMANSILSNVKSESIRQIRDDLANSFVKERVAQIESPFNSSGAQEIQSHFGQTSGLKAPQDNTFSDLSVKGSSNNTLENEVRNKMGENRETIRNANDTATAQLSATNNGLQNKAQKVIDQSHTNKIWKKPIKEF